ncbi:sigma factor-binding protein Crl [Celerinatantimonas sp. YJH-8]|uniref:sigma factor-binding protein Crl n=1 Tax=Celerinatantimonas sp. YJH-8 TaxID=3228714 RepID=UPI0038C3DC07
MSEQWPSHGRLINRFNSLGPYLRQPLSDTTCYFFDCLSECADARVDPEIREFYGWWLTLSVQEGHFEYCYWYGFFDKQGNWQEKAIPNAYQKNVQDTLQNFYTKLLELLDELDIELTPSSQLDPSRVLAA